MRNKGENFLRLDRAKATDLNNVLQKLCFEPLLWNFEPWRSCRMSENVKYFVPLLEIFIPLFKCEAIPVIYPDDVWASAQKG